MATKPLLAATIDRVNVQSYEFNQLGSCKTRAGADLRALQVGDGGVFLMALQCLVLHRRSQTQGHQMQRLYQFQGECTGIGILNLSSGIKPWAHASEGSPMGQGRDHRVLI